MNYVGEKLREEKKLMMSSSSSSQKQQMRGNSGSCEDCGNKAKRDCEHMRCRTCCKSRGLPCPTHVRSTWIPAARRRRLLHHRLSLSVPSSSAFPRLLTTGLEERNMNQGLPAEVTAVANFRCVRVSSDDNAVDQAAYQTSVNIGGHFFNGLLYDQGPSSSGAAQTHQYPHRHHHHHHPGGGDAGGSTSGGGFMLPPPFNPFLPNAAGMQFFFQPKP